VVGTNKHDAHETVASLLADAEAGLLHSGGPVDDLVDTLLRRGLQPVLLDNWRAIDAAETALGASRGRRRTTLHERQLLLDAALRRTADSAAIVE
jgi:ferredoxin--NADP+ reductase